MTFESKIEMMVVVKTFFQIDHVDKMEKAIQIFDQDS